MFVTDCVPVTCASSAKAGTWLSAQPPVGSPQPWQQVGPQQIDPEQINEEEMEGGLNE